MRTVLMLVIVLGLVTGFGLGLMWLDREPTRDTATWPKRTMTFAFQTQSAGTRLLKKGWSTPEPWGVWTIGSRAELAIPIRERLEGDISINLEARAFVVPSQVDGQSVIIEANGTEVARLNYGRNDSQRATRLVTVPKHVATRNNPILIAFNIAAPRSPVEFGLSNDDRKLGIGLQTLTLTFPSSEVYDN